jgi:type IV pilus assembly protein PilO
MMLDKLNNLSLVVKAVIALVLAAAVGGGGWYSLVLPMNASIVEKTSELEAKQKKNKELLEFESKVNQLDRDIVFLKQQMERNREIVPDEKEADKLIVLLQETATNTGVGLRGLKAGNVSNKEFYTEVPFSVELDGPYYGMMQFFEKLSQQTRIVNVEGLKMSSLAKNNKGFNYAPNESVIVSCIVKTFYSRDPAKR